MSVHVGEPPRLEDVLCSRRSSNKLRYSCTDIPPKCKRGIIISNLLTILSSYLSPLCAAPCGAGARLSASSCVPARSSVRHLNRGGKVDEGSPCTPGSQLTPRLPSDWLPVAPLGRLHLGRKKKEDSCMELLWWCCIRVPWEYSPTWRPSNAIIEVFMRGLGCSWLLF